MSKDIYVIDLFCGCGGFSEGARQAGARVALAIDYWEEALAVHEANHPDTTHVCMELGGDVEEFTAFLLGFIDLYVPKEARVHVHASPPCQNLSSANPERDESTGMHLVEWSLALLSGLKKITKRELTWSLEQVAHSGVTEYIQRYGGLVVKMEEYGVPQRRRRAFLGCLPWQDLKKDYLAETFREIITRLKFQPREGMTSLTSGTAARSSDGSVVKHSDGRTAYTSRNFADTCITITNTHPVFYDPEKHRSTMLPLSIAMAVQTFSPDYCTPVSPATARRLVANAIPPKFARLLVGLLS